MRQTVMSWYIIQLDIIQFDTLQVVLLLLLLFFLVNITEDTNVQWKGYGRKGEQLPFTELGRTG